VLLHHAAWKGVQYSTDPLSWFHVGSAGIDLFFIISGFIMCFATENKHQQKGSFRKFIKNRVLRIIPLYLILTTVALIVYIIYPEKVNSTGGKTSIIDSYFLIPTESYYASKAVEGLSKSTPKIALLLSEVALEFHVRDTQFIRDRLIPIALSMADKRELDEHSKELFEKAARTINKIQSKTLDSISEAFKIAKNEHVVKEFPMVVDV
jgi:hypothetical protein